MNVHSCLICIGSNSNRETNMPFAREALKKYFPDIVYGREMTTAPLYLENPALFSNQLGKFTTLWDIAKVTDVLKMIEIEAGRLPADKKQEIVRLDIDLLEYDGIVLKPQDMEKDYIRQGKQLFSK